MLRKDSRGILRNIFFSIVALITIEVVGVVSKEDLHLDHACFFEPLIIERESVSTLYYLNLLCEASEDIDSDHNTNYWIVGLDDVPMWIIVAWKFVQPTIIMRCLDIPLGLNSLWILAVQVLSGIFPY